MRSACRPGVDLGIRKKNRPHVHALTLGELTGTDESFRLAPTKNDFKFFATEFQFLL